MKTSETTDQIFPAFLKAQREMGPLVKDANNPFFKSNYATLEAVLDVVVPVMHANDIAVTQGNERIEGGINVITRLIHSSGQWIETYCPIPMNKQDAQAAGSATSYGRRYGLKAIAALSEEDDDGNGASERDPAKDRSDESLLEITDTQIKEIKELFSNLSASPENIKATVRKFSADRTDSVEALMKTEARSMIPKLRAKLKEKATV